jgi:hypothetical protein
VGNHFLKITAWLRGGIEIPGQEKKEVFMLKLKERQVCSNCSDDLCLFQDTIVDKGLFVPCKTFYVQQDRYGKDRIYLLFPLDARIFRGRLVPSANHTTIVVWSFGRLVTPKGVTVLTHPDENPGVFFNLLSARKGTVIKARDEYEEMELVF